MEYQLNAGQNSAEKDIFAIFGLLFCSHDPVAVDFIGFKFGRTSFI